MTQAIRGLKKLLSAFVGVCLTTQVVATSAVLAQGSQSEAEISTSASGEASDVLTGLVLEEPKKTLQGAVSQSAVAENEDVLVGQVVEEHPTQRPDHRMQDTARAINAVGTGLSIFGGVMSVVGGSGGMGRGMGHGMGHGISRPGRVLPPVPSSSPVPSCIPGCK